MEKNRKTAPLKIGNLTARIPVMQGGMGVGISLSGLAGAVAAAGGIGIISAAQAGFRDPSFDKDPIGCNLQAIKGEVKRAKEIAGGGIIGVNIMTVTRSYEKYVEAAIEAGADLIVSGAGLPMTLPELTKGSEIKLLPIVSGVKATALIMKYWLKKYRRLPDGVVIEGPLAGGHLGFSPEQLAKAQELDFDKEIVEIIETVKQYEREKDGKIPVIVAGGIYERDDMLHQLSLGAEGVQMGTRFVTTYECDADDAYKQAYIKAQKEDIVIVKSPVGMPGRAIKNSFIQRTQQGALPHGLCHQCIRTCKPTQTPYCITDALINAAKGNTKEGLLFCGSNAYRAKKLEKVADIMKEFS